jgi:hypothetical protein
LGILDDLKSRFRASGRAEPGVSTAHVAQSGATADTSDMMLAGQPEPEPLLDGLSIGITYEDLDGNLSERLVNCIKLMDTPEGRVLWAYCHLRTDFRAFALDRIRQIRDYRTGAQTPDPEAFFAPFLARAGYEQKMQTESETRATREVLGLVGDELRILMFVALADRHFDRSEEELISEFIRRRARQLGTQVFETYDHERVLDWMRGQVPTFDVLERAVHRLLGRGEWELRALWDLSKDIVHADEHVDPAEVQAMDDLYNAIDSAIKGGRAYL